MSSVAAPEIRPRADIAKSHQRWQRPRNLVKRAEIVRAGDRPAAGPTLATPSDDLVPLGGLVLSDARKVTLRDRWINASYLVAITVAMIGWLWLIAWTALRLI